MLRYKPCINRDDAEKHLSLRNKVFPFKKILPARVELVEIPYYFFELDVNTKKRGTKKFHAALDGILGTFAMFDPGALESEDVKKDFEFRFSLGYDDAEKMVMEESRWELYRRALKDRERYEIRKISEPCPCYYPFWVGYFEKNKKWDFTALDAVSGVLQGGPMRRVFIKAFCDKNLKEKIERYNNRD